MKSPNVNETQSVAKVVYAINNASSVVCIFSSRLIDTFKRAVEIATKDDIVVRVGSQFVRQFIEKRFLETWIIWSVNVDKTKFFIL